MDLEIGLENVSTLLNRMHNIHMGQHLKNAVDKERTSPENNLG